MKSFTYFLLIAEVILAICFGLMFIGYPIMPDMNMQDTEAVKLGSIAFMKEDQALNDTVKKVAVYDRGLQMIRGSYLIPHNWLVQQDISTDPYSGGSLSNFFLSFNGPEGEIIRSHVYNGYYKLGKASDFKDFEEELQPLLKQSLKGFMDEMHLEEIRSGKPTEARYLRTYIDIDSTYQYLEVPFKGILDGEAYQGLVRIVYPTSSYYDLRQITLGIVTAPEDKLAETLKKEEQIAFSYQANPAFEEYCLHLYKAYQRAMDRYIPERIGWHPDSSYYTDYNDWNYMQSNTY
ncbi:hypothetical protein OKW21_000730 [Catalinimonas alkaloidigena]|uniref:hypothetical protein n=1 Tax=Catalinimonas alkaloidigena TaxID=1075417 RepID=UPI0024075EE5|nr:hypothetical protein [Catalinimonas alkaloidigena]MDF9795467.1 hypothetical protein [Catalinimonas alkaloidigena]